MAYEVELRFPHLSGTVDSVTLHYRVTGSPPVAETSPGETADQVIQAVLTVAPSTVFAMPINLGGATVEEVQAATGNEIWFCDLPYAMPNNTVSNKPPGDYDSGSAEYEFDFSTQGVTVKQGFSETGYIRTGMPNPPPSAPSHGGLIGVNSDGTVEGTSVERPTSSFSISMTQPRAFFSESYLRSVEDLVGSTNDSVFLGRLTATVLFVGASGRVSTTGNSTINFRFRVRKNNTGPDALVFPGFPPVETNAWDVVWPWYEPVPENNWMPIKPSFIYVNTVYPEGDFNILGLGPPGP